MQEENNRIQSHTILTNVLWKFMERGSAVIVTLLVNIILARLLDPAVHGLLAMVTVFVAISEIFVTAGPGSALIQKKDTDAKDFSTVFWLNLGASCGLYAVLFLAAPSIARYFGYSELSSILRVLSLRLIISAVNSIQCAYISRNMMFRHYFFSTLSGKIISGMIGITMAYTGAGVWALVAQSVSQTFIETFVLWFRVKWRPTMQFSWKSGKTLYKFAYRVMFTHIVETITGHIRSLMIGKRYSSVDLAFYNKGVLFPNSMTTNVTSALSAVMYPVLSGVQDERERLKDTDRQWIRLFAYMMFPLLTGMAVTAKLWMPMLLTQKWAPAVPYLQITCGVYAAWIIEVPIRDAITASGRAGVSLKMQVIKTMCSLCVLLFVFRRGVLVIALSSLGCAGFNVLVSAYNAMKYLHYSPIELCGDVAMPTLFSLCVAFCALLLERVISAPLLCLFAQVICGFGVYIILSIATRNREFIYAVNMLRKMKKS